ncbi:MAG: hypothetical protein EBU35_07960 [Marivivens sp.]|nr:hypothetical protein [Marivivens sp.]
MCIRQAVRERHVCRERQNARGIQSFWIKGETSGHHQELVDFTFDCDNDCILVKVRQTGPACHTNRRSCFYTAVRDGETVELMTPMA